MNSKHPALLATQHWLQNVVIGENFCPFAKREFDRKRIRYVILETNEMSSLQSLLVQEYELLDSDPKGELAETTLLIFPPPSEHSPLLASDVIDSQNFDDFLLVTEEANWQLAKLGYEGIYQLASFHPQYLFAGESPESPSHYTNRSPFPMLHIIRESSIDRALKTFKQPESIPEVNITRANTLGSHYFQKQLVESFAFARAKQQQSNSD